MIKSVTITNHLNESITMELRFPEKSGFLIRNIEGLGPSKATIDITEVSAIDGSIYNSSRVTSRNIVFSLGFLEKPTIEDVRQLSYKYFPLKKKIKILIETTNRLCETYGYVESNEPNIFSKEEGATISVICPDSYLYSLVNSVTIFSAVEANFGFPFSNESLVDNMIIFGNMSGYTTKSVIYNGDAPIGATMYIHALGPATNISIMNVRTGEKMTINSARLIALMESDIQQGDDIIISTVKGNKFVYLQRNAELYNILNALDKNPDWFQLEKGDNVFAYTADVGLPNLQFRVENLTAYEGI